jgi:RNA polymerase sigma-70 factor (ECF subfamily)
MVRSVLSAERQIPIATRLVPKDDDERLVRAAQERPDEFGALYERHFEAIYRYLQVRMAPADAADLTQQVFLKAFAALPKYRARGLPFSAWLFRIARNLAADHHRLNRRTPDELMTSVAESDSRVSPEEAALQMEMHGRLRLLIRELDADKRELLAMRFAGGLSSREIAAVIGKSESAIKKQLTRILHNLKEKYSES